jgi:hypothetical protein
VLSCERQTKAIERRIRSAARAAGIVNRATVRSFFEHGQWWIEHASTGAQWSVCDSEGGASTFDGFCFEQVTQGEGE